MNLKFAAWTILQDLSHAVYLHSYLLTFISHYMTNFYMSFYHACNLHVMIK